MSFIAADEHIIVLDWPHMALTADDLRLLRDCGIRTAYASLDWDVVEPRPGAYDWSLYDGMAARYRQADMRLLLQCHACAVDWGPDDWYAAAPGRLWRHFVGWQGPEHYTIISPWSAEGQAAELAFLQRCVEHFAGSNVQCVRGGPHGGEVLLPGIQPCYVDPGALASYRAFVGDRHAAPADLPTYASMAAHQATVAWLRQSLTQMVMAQQHIMAAQPWHEVWFFAPERATTFAEACETGPRTGNWLLPELYPTLPVELGAELHIMFFEVFRGSDTQGILENVKEYRHRVWCGSQFCQGLYANTASAIDRGLRGFLTGPVHPQSGCDRLEPWMLEAFRRSLAQWQANRP